VTKAEGLEGVMLICGEGREGAWGERDGGRGTEEGRRE